jgi:hypothetical protein
MHSCAWPVVLVGLGQGGGGGQPARVAADGLVDDELVHALHVAEQPAGLAHAEHVVAAGGGEARGVVGAEEIVVHGLGDADAVQLVAVLAAVLLHPMDGVHGVVAADEEEIADVVLAQHLEDAGEVLFLDLMAGGSQGRGRGGAQAFEDMGGLAAQVEQALFHKALDAEIHAVYVLGQAGRLDLVDHPGQAGVDDGSRSA